MAPPLVARSPLDACVMVMQSACSTGRARMPIIGRGEDRAAAAAASGSTDQASNMGKMVQPLAANGLDIITN